MKLDRMRMRPVQAAPGWCTFAEDERPTAHSSPPSAKRLTPSHAIMAMPAKRKPQPDQLAQARWAAIIVACITGLITYTSVKTMGTLVVRQHAGASAAAASASVATGGGWKDTWRLASELGAGAGWAARPQRGSPPLPPFEARGGLTMSCRFCL